MIEKQDDVIVFIDNGYLKKVSARFKSQNVFNCDIKKFAINLAKEQKLFCKKIYFYDAPPFEDNKNKSKKNQNLFLFNHLLDACDFVGLIKKEHLE